MDEVAAALAAIQVRYEPLPTMIGLEAALAPDAPEIWQDAHSDAPTAAEGVTLPGRWQGNLRQTRLNMGSFNPGRARHIVAQTGLNGGHVVAAQYSNHIQVHTAFEPHCAVAYWPDDSHLDLYLSTQAVTAMRPASHFEDRAAPA